MFRGCRLIILAIAGLALVGANSPSQNSTGDHPAAEANQKARNHENVAAGVSRIGNALEAQNAKPDPYEKERNEREIRDLQAQENSAYWAGAMFWATVSALILSAIGVGLVWTTFRETRLATGVAQDNLAAVIDAERGILKFENHAQIGPAPNAKHLASLTINTENIGRSALTVRRIMWHSSLDAEWPAKYANASELSDIVKPGANHQIEYIKHEPLGEGIYFVLGECGYETILGRKFTTYFCYWVTMRTNPDNIGRSFRVVEMKHFPDHPRNT